MPGPPRAFDVMAILAASRPRNPARRAASDRAMSVRTDEPRRNASRMDNENSRPKHESVAHQGKVDGNEERGGDLGNGVEGVGEVGPLVSGQAARQPEAGEERGQHDTHPKRRGNADVRKEHEDRVGQRRGPVQNVPSPRANSTEERRRRKQSDREVSERDAGHATLRC